MKNYNHKISYIVIVIFVAINLLLFSSVSPLHSLMNMQYNEWLYYLIGKGMTRGLVPYVDLVDHKGPYLFYFFAIANLLPYKHIGLYLVAVIFYSLIAVFIYNIANLILKNVELTELAPTETAPTEDSQSSIHANSLTHIVICLIVALVIHMMVSSYYMSFGSISAEVFTAPFVLISYYLFLKYLYSGEIKHNIRYMIVYGLAAGISFFIKANAVLAYVPIAIYLFIYLIKNKQIKNLFWNFIVGLLSFVAALMPAIIYSIVTNSFSEMIEGAFTINILYTGTGMPSSGSVVDSLMQTIMEFKEFTIICIASIFVMRYFLNAVNNKNVETHILAFYVMSLIINIYSVYMSCRPYTNYLVYLIFYFISIILFFVGGMVEFIAGRLMTAHTEGSQSFAPTVVLIVAIVVINILSYSFTFELSSINGEKQRTIANRAIKIYRDSGMKKNNLKMLVVGYAPYLYEAFDTIPNEKYFAVPVVSRKKYSKPYDAIINRIKKGDEDLIIVSFERQMLKDKSFQSEVYDTLENDYESIGETKYLGEKIELFIKNN